MPFIKIVDPEDATGAAKDLYESTRSFAAQQGYDAYTNLAKIWSPAAECAQVWARSLGVAGAATKLSAVEREIITCRLTYLLKSRYVLCSHAFFLHKMTGWSLEQIEGIVWRPQESDLDMRLKQILRFSEKAVRESHAITQGDIDALRGEGLSEEQIVGLVFYVGALANNSIFPNALGAELDAFSQPFAPLADWA